ncbi:distal tail protein Dit [Coprococcus catus]
MPLTVNFNGVDITEYITVLDGFTVHSGINWDPSFVSVSGKNGESFTHTRYKAKEIPMPFAIKGDINTKYDEISKALSVSDPKELTFSNIPDRMFYAIPKGDFEFTEVNKTSGIGTITWLIPDGLAHSTTEKTFQASENVSGVLEATVTNSGTESIPVSYDITHNHENGFIGIVSEYGVLQYGSVDEADDEAREKSEVLLKYTKPSDYSAMTEGKGILASNDTFPMTGKFTGYEDGWLRLQSSGSGSSWHGAARQVTLPADSSGNSGAVNFVAQTKIWFETSDASQDGLLEFVVGDTDGNHLASIHLVKGVGTAECTPIFQVQAKEKGRISYVPNSNSVTNRNNGNMEIRKSGELFEFLFGGKTYPYRVPEAKDKKALTLTIFIGQYANRANPVNQMAFGTMSFRKDNVQYRVDIPNRYAEGDVITIDGETTKMYVNGVPALGDEVKGSKHFHVPPGESKIQFYFSEFCDPKPDITVRIREAYL